MSGKVETNQKTPCVLEISDKGIKMVDKSKPGVRGEIYIFYTAALESKI